MSRINRSPYPTLKWSQNADTITISALFSDQCVKNEDIICEIHSNNETSSELLIKVPGFSIVQFPLYEMCQKCIWKLKPDQKTLSISATKATSNLWPRLSQSKEKLHFISTDWIHWGGENEDMIPNFHQTTAASLGPIELSPRDQNLIQNIPDLKDLISVENDSKVQKFWTTNLTSAQRLHTLARLWNVLLPSERPDVLRNLVILMNEVDGDISKNIKGGEQVLADITPHEYDSHKIDYARPWIESIKSLENTSTRLDVLRKLFSTCTDHEKKLICSTFL